MDLTDRIIEYCKRKNVKQIDLIKAGCGSKGTINNVFRKKNDPNSRFLEAFIRAYPINARWLFTGEEEQNIIEDQRQLLGFCKECLKKEGIIDYQKKIITEKDKRIEELLLKLTDKPKEYKKAL